MKKVSLSKLNSFILVISIFLSGCGETYCPAFPYNIANWFPYSTNDTIRLSKDTNSTISLPITQFLISEGYSFSKRWDCACRAEMSFETAVDTFNLISLRASIVYGDGINLEEPLPIEIRIGIYEKKNELLIPILDDEFFCKEYSDWEMQDSAMIDGKYFEDVLIIKNIENSKYQEITLIKGIGIYRITDKESNIWRVNLEE